jgi:hypothetical protein
MNSYWLLEVLAMLCLVWLKLNCLTCPVVERRIGGRFLLTQTLKGPK